MVSQLRFPLRYFSKLYNLHVLFYKSVVECCFFGIMGCPLLINNCTHNVYTVFGLGTKRVNVRLPEKLVREADGIAKVEHKNRTELIKEALTNYLQKHEDEEEFKEKVVDLYLEGEISYEILEAVIGRRDAEAAKASKDILERGDEIAEKMADFE